MFKESCLLFIGSPGTTYGHASTPSQTKAFTHKNHIFSFIHYKNTSKNDLPYFVDVSIRLFLAVVFFLIPPTGLSRYQQSPLSAA